MGTYAVNFQGPPEAAAALDAAGIQQFGSTGPLSGPERYTYVVEADSEEAARGHVEAVLRDVPVGDLAVRAVGSAS